jgi:hypothetical protein
MENNYKEITYLGSNEKVMMYLSESKSQFQQKIEYIKKLEKASINWKEANRLSKIWYCIKFKNCRYMPEVYNKIMRYDK